MTVFCPSCGTANRDDVEMCSECGNVIPKLSESTSNTNFGIETSSQDFGIQESYPPPPPPDDLTPSIDFGIEIDEKKPLPPPPPDQSGTSYPTAYPPYDGQSLRAQGQRTVCERCGTVLRSDDAQCTGCGKPINTSANQKVPPPPKKPPSPYSPPSPYAPLNPGASQTANSKPEPSRAKPKVDQKIAKCAKCGAIVYDYETRCDNCGRILAPPTKKPKDQPSKVGKAPPGTARCGRCNAIVYPHQTICPNCSKPLAPVESVIRSPGQRMTRCRRCGSKVYPTDRTCKNCGRKLDPV